MGQDTLETVRVHQGHQIAKLYMV